MTSDNLRRGIPKPLKHSHCKEIKSVKHLLFDCILAQQLSADVQTLFGLRFLISSLRLLNGFAIRHLIIQMWSLLQPCGDCGFLGMRLCLTIAHGWTRSRLAPSAEESAKLEYYFQEPRMYDARCLFKTPGEHAQDSFAAGYGLKECKNLGLCGFLGGNLTCLGSWWWVCNTGFSSSTPFQERCRSRDPRLSARRWPLKANSRAIFCLGQLAF